MKRVESNLCTSQRTYRFLTRSRSCRLVSAGQAQILPPPWEGDGQTSRRGDDAPLVKGGSEGGSDPARLIGKWVSISIEIQVLFSSILSPHLS